MPGTVSHSGIESIRVTRAEQSRGLRVLVSSPFNPQNEEHLRSIKQYTDAFELFLNQMYLAKAIGEAFKLCCGLLVVGWVTPFVPEFIEYIAQYLMYLSIAALLFERYNTTDFLLQCETMETLYNWCLKGSQPDWSSSVDNTRTLACPDVQRMMKLLAPLCSVEFMVAWPKVTESAASVASQGMLRKALAGAAGFFVSATSSSAAQPSADEEARIRKIKTRIERREYDHNLMTGLNQAIQYFLTNPEFRAPYLAKIDMVKSTVSALRETAAGFLQWAPRPGHSPR